MSKKPDLLTTLAGLKIAADTIETKENQKKILKELDRQDKEAKRREKEEARRERDRKIREEDERLERIQEDKKRERREIERQREIEDERRNAAEEQERLKEAFSFKQDKLEKKFQDRLSAQKQQLEEKEQELESLTNKFYHLEKKTEKANQEFFDKLNQIELNKFIASIDDYGLSIYFSKILFEYGLEKSISIHELCKRSKQVALEQSIPNSFRNDEHPWGKIPWCKQTADSTVDTSNSFISLIEKHTKAFWIKVFEGEVTDYWKTLDTTIAKWVRFNITLMKAEELNAEIKKTQELERLQREKEEKIKRAQQLEEEKWLKEIEDKKKKAEEENRVAIEIECALQVAEENQKRQRLLEEASLKKLEQEKQKKEQEIRSKKESEEYLQCLKRSLRAKRDSLCRPVFMTGLIVFSILLISFFVGMIGYLLHWEFYTLILKVGAAVLSVSWFVVKMPAYALFESYPEEENEYLSERIRCICNRFIAQGVSHNEIPAIIEAMDKKVFIQMFVNNKLPLNLKD